MSRSHSRRQLTSYRRRRRSPIPVLIFLAALVMLAVVLFQVFRSRGEAESLPSPSVIPSPVPSTPAPSDVPSPVPLEEAPWYLMLANLDHPLPADWEIETVTISNGLEVDQRIISALDDMLDDCRAAGLSPLVCSAYRTVQRQTELFEEKIDVLMADGLSYDEAYAAAATVVAIPGTSEHNLGLAVDICALDYQILDDAQADTPEQQWLMEHCAEYGFILRYPKGKEDMTGIIWEPWHYRYVGVEAAQDISQSGLCLEEYLALHYSGV